MFSAGLEVGKIIKLFPNEHLFDETVAIATQFLKLGKVVALPSDTLYGIAALAQNSAAVDTLTRVKKRENGLKFLSICVGCIEDIPKWGNVSFPKKILSGLLPGPVTLIMERSSALNSALNPHTTTVGIRIPKSKFIQSVASACDEPLACTSANISTEPSTLEVQEFKELWPNLDLIIDGGTLGQIDPNRLGSTIVDLTKEEFYKIIRNGCALEHTVEILEANGLKQLT